MCCVGTDAMGWIKAKLADDTHDKLRARVQNDDRPTHEVAAELIERAMECENDE